MREAMQKLMKESDAEIEKLLTKEQGKKFDEYKKERNEEIRNRMKERQR
jgi:Spy/CpxP family protein refolding chaperone